MRQNIGEVLGKIAGAAICKASCSKSMPVRRPVTMYSKPNKKLMPQPAYIKQASPFANLLAAAALESMPEEQAPVPQLKKRSPMAKKITACGPVRGTMLMRRKSRRQR